MNRYGQLAQEHWRRWLPTRYAAIPNPEEFFSTLGLEVQDQVSNLSQQLEGPDLPGEGYLAKLGRLNMAKLQAEEQVLAELVYLTPEPELEQEDEQDLLNDPALAGTRQMVEFARLQQQLKDEDWDED